MPETKKADDSESADGAEDEPTAGSWRVLLQSREWRGVALAEGCARVGYAAKLASVPVLASEVLPGGATSAGALLSAAGLSGLVGAPLGGFITDRIGGWFQVYVPPLENPPAPSLSHAQIQTQGARRCAVVSGVLSGAALLAVPVALALPAAETLAGASALPARAAIL